MSKLEDFRRTVEEDWKISPALMMMDRETYRDLVILSLVESGWTEIEAVTEANLRLERMLNNSERVYHLDLAGKKMSDCQRRVKCVS